MTEETAGTSSLQHLLLFQDSSEPDAAGEFGDIRLFELALPPAGWIYPCSLADLRRRLATFPTEDLQGLHAVGLVPATRKDWKANGRYFFGSRPTIRIYSRPDSLTYRLPPHVKRGEIENGLAVELEYGMRAVSRGARWTCEWDREDLRRFILEEVLPHEIGHHVRDTRRRLAGYVHSPWTRESEQFAEAYAARYRRALEDTLAPAGSELRG